MKPTQHRLSCILSSTFDATRQIVNIGGGGYCGDYVSSSPIPLAIQTVPQGVVATSGSKSVTISATHVATATKYNIYWNTTGGVTTASNKISNVTLPYTQMGRTTGVTYYYVVPSVINGTESTISAQVGAPAN